MSIRSLFNELNEVGINVVVIDENCVSAVLDGSRSSQSLIEELSSSSRTSGYFVRQPGANELQVEQCLRKWGGDGAAKIHHFPVYDNAFTNGEERLFLRAEAAHLLHEGLARIRGAAGSDPAFVEAISDALYHLPNNVVADGQRSLENLRELIGPARKVLLEARADNKKHSNYYRMIPSPAVMYLMSAIAAVDAVTSLTQGKFVYGSVASVLSMICALIGLVSWRRKKVKG
ncbi:MULTISPECIES: hypothetical protein [unclassified Pseudomonas]|uniref:hypothetical protein n=1 Tax=unclassified Pseudomonas TaxID=196821 RepID=UPI00190AD668|nr:MULTISPECIES: hypothetical protein [unclassified Pseudomonas]MBK3468581.1 hypothetical protein [Pseudomonas sp. MF6776]